MHYLKLWKVMKLSEQVNNSKEKLMESYFSYIGSSHIENVINELEEKKEEINKIQVSKKLDNWFKDYIKKIKKKDKKIKAIKNIKNVSSRAAIFILILLMSLSVMTISVEAFRVRVFNFIVETNEKYTSMKVDEKVDYDENSILTWDGYYSLLYIPEGFEVDNKDIFNGMRIVQCSSKLNYITFAQAPNGTDFHLDTEGCNISKIMIDDDKGILAVKEEKNILFWNNDDSSFYIISDLNIEEIIKIAKKVEIK